MIRREIEVTRKGLPRPIDVTYGTDLMPFEFIITDFPLPEGVTTRAYAIGGSQKAKSQSCNVTGNKIFFTPELGLFEEGKNILQLEITYNSKNLYTFCQPVNCHYTIGHEGAKDVESDPSYVELLLQLKQDVSKLKNDFEGFESGSVTKASIVKALGYTPADQTKVTQLSQDVANLRTEIGLEVTNIASLVGGEA